MNDWRKRLVVANCVRTTHEIYNHNTYICPYTGGSYSFMRSKYFGAYNDKKVMRIYEVAAVVVVDKGGKNAHIKFNNHQGDSEEYIREGLRLVRTLRKSESLKYPLQVFILRNEAELQMNKTSKGGMWGTKIYFHGIADTDDNSLSLAEKLNVITW